MMGWRDRGDDRHRELAPAAGALGREEEAVDGTSEAPSPVDVVVIGMGPGGEFVASGLLEEGLNVVAVESQLIGGECAMWGCVPTKMMIRSANLLAEARRVNGMAGSADVDADWSKVSRRIREEATTNWDDIEQVRSFQEKGGIFVRGTAKVVQLDVASIDRWEDETGVIGGSGHPMPATLSVIVDEIRYTPRLGIVLAVGAEPSVPAIPGLVDVEYWTNRDVVQLEELPRSLVILGGGAIAVELGQVLSSFGVDVTIVEVADRLLSSEEPEASDLIEKALRQDRVTIMTGVEVRSVIADDGSFTLDIGGGGSVTADHLLVATGRRPLMGDLGWAAMGIDPAASSVEVDEHMRVAPGVWAVGDITDHGAFTHVATHQAEIVVRDILGEPTYVAKYGAVPRVVFTDPEIGSVGLTEQAARASGLNVGVGIAPIPSEARGWIHKAGNGGIIKLIADVDRGVLVGALSVGPSGGEVLALLTLAIHADVSLATLRLMYFAYPTFHRAVSAALLNLQADERTGTSLH